MDTVGHVLMQPGNVQKKIILAAAVLIALMLMFPPKYTGERNPFTGQVVTRSAGYLFLLSDPTGAQRAALPGLPEETASAMFVGGVEYGKLLVQILVVAGLAFMLLRFVVNPPLQRGAQPSS